METGQETRRQAMAVLAKADASELHTAWRDWPSKPEISVVRPPETGLVMVRGKMGGNGAGFNLGEVTVTRSVVALSDGTTGHAYVMGRDKEKARLAAIFDALWQGETRGAVDDYVLEPIRARINAGQKEAAGETSATKVEFFTMVRGEN